MMFSTTTDARIHVVFLEPRGIQANVFDQFMNIPMLGPILLGTLAEQAGYRVTILNENILGRAVTQDELLEADILCLSCMTATVERGKDIARTYKALRTARGLASRSIIGGIHASMIPEDVEDDFDQVFVGEAEEKILALLAGELPEKRVLGTPVQDLDTLPIPNFRLLKNWQKIRVWPVMTSRGCPFDCNFCSVTEMFGRGYRTKSVARVLQEVEGYDQRYIFFVDDHFALQKKRTRELVQGIRALGHRLTWSCQLRTEVSRDQALVAQMRQAGCRTVYIGFESINPASLKEMNKGQNVEDIKRSITVFKQHGIRVHGMFMLGADADHQDVFKTTSAFCKASGLASVQYLAMTPLPGTHLFRQMEAQGRLLHKDWRYYDAMHVVFQPRHLTPMELQQGLIDCFSDFYSYTHGLHDAINIFFETLESLVKSFYRRAYLPPWIAPWIKIAGKRIVRQWIRSNRPYLDMLKHSTWSIHLSRWYESLCTEPGGKSPRIGETRGKGQSVDLFSNPLKEP